MTQPVTLYSIPLIGSVGASRTHDFIEVKQWRDVTPVRNARPFDRYIATPVEGDSLIGDRICDGDIVIIRLTFSLEEISPGKLVSLITPAGLLIKHIYQTLDDQVRLVSSNKVYPDLLYDIDLVEIRGVVVRVEWDI